MGFKLVLLNALFFHCFVISLIGQSLPLSRADSGEVLSNLEKYKGLIEKQEYNEASRCMNNIAYIYWKKNQNRLAADYYERSLKLNGFIENENGIAMIHNNLGMIYSDLGEFDKALSHFDRTLASRRSQKEPVSIISCLINRSVIYNNIKRYDASIADLQEALTLARQMNDANQMASVYAMLSETYEKMGKVDESLKYFLLFKSFHDQLQKKELSRLKNVVDSESYKKQMALTEAKNKEILLLKSQLETKEKQQELSSMKSENSTLYENLSRKEMLEELQRKVIKEKEGKAAIFEAKNQSLEKEKAYTRNLIVLFSLFALSIFLIVYSNYNKTKKINRQLAAQNLAIEEKNQQLEASNDVKSKIFSIIGHDLRGPVASLKAFFSIMDYYDMPDDLREVLQHLGEDTVRLSAILENLLNWAKTQMSELIPDIKTVEIKSLTEENVALLNNAATNKQIKLIDEFPADLTAQTDMEMTRIVIRNLVQNAIKFTKKGGTVLITGEKRDGKVFVHIKDDGVGMDEEKVKTLFKIKSNTSTNGTNKEKGTGLGLVLSYDFIKLCSGDILVSSQLGKGSTFSVQLVGS